MASKQLSVEDGSPELLEPVSLTFKNIGFSVKDRRTGATVQILKGIDGRIEPKRLMVIMGSSGAGKTTLLDVLACNMFGSGTVSGEVLVNGAPRNRREFSQISCYVMQRDVLLASSTVREALLIAALLKLPRSMPTAEKVAQVDAVLADLELERCQHTLIGDEVLGMKGISGGQRRRVSVGVELVKSPRVLFMDEPTSGLDSEMAVSLVDTLVRLARQNRTVCTTIHQPNSYITSKFDDLMLLHAGAVAYAGPWSDSVSYFASQGCPCPQYTNPTDFYMATLKEKGDELTAAWAKQGHGLNGLAALEAGEASAVVAGEGKDGGRVLEEPALELQTAPRASWPYQVYVLGGRMLRMWWRNPAMLVSESAQYAFMAVFVGLVYLQVSDSVATGINDRAASMWLAMAILSFTPSYTSVVIWDKDRLLLRRETQQGMYNVTAWFAAKTVTTWPVEILQTTLFCVVAYWMVGYAPSAAAFFIFVAAFCMFQLTSETVGTICAIICGNATYSILLLTFVLLFLLSFSGFLVSAVPVGRAGQPGWSPASGAAGGAPEPPAGRRRQTAQRMGPARAAAGVAATARVVQPQRGACAGPGTHVRDPDPLAVSRDALQVYFRWIAKISYLTYAYAAVVQNEFTRIDLTTESGETVSGAAVYDGTWGGSLLGPTNNGLSIAANVGVLLAITVGTRALAFALLFVLHKLKRL